MAHRRVLHEVFSRWQETAAHARSGGQRPTPGRLARCRSDTTAALDTAFLQKRPEETTVWLKDLASTFSAR